MFANDSEVKLVKRYIEKKKFKTDRLKKYLQYFLEKPMEM